MRLQLRVSKVNILLIRQRSGASLQSCHQSSFFLSDILDETLFFFTFQKNLLILGSEGTTKRDENTSSVCFGGVHLTATQRDTKCVSLILSANYTLLEGAHVVLRFLGVLCRGLLEPAHVFCVARCGTILTGGKVKG